MNSILWLFIVYIQIVLHLDYDCIIKYQNSAVKLGNSKTASNVCTTMNTNGNAQQLVR